MVKYETRMYFSINLELDTCHRMKGFVILHGIMKGFVILHGILIASSYLTKSILYLFYGHRLQVVLKK